MSTSAMDPVLEEWFTIGEAPHLLGTRCTQCGTYYFPKAINQCRNPICDSTQLEPVELSRTGKLWSFTNACYTPPPPYVAAEPFVPFAIAAVELAVEKMVVLGQVVEGVDMNELQAGQSMELVVEPIPDQAAAAGKLVWKWKPMKEGVQ